MPQSNGEKPHETGASSERSFARRALLSSESESAFGRLLSNAKDFFTEAPPRAARGQDSPLRFFTAIGENLRELLRPSPKLASVDMPDLQFAAPQMSRDPQFTRVQSLSITMHVLLLTLLVAPALPELLHPATSTRVIWQPSDFIRYFHPPAPLNQPGNRPGGASGERNPLPATNGAAPLFARIQLVPLRARPPENLQVPIPPTLIGDPSVAMPRSNLTNWGDPASRSNNDSSGPGIHGGIGNGTDYGDGDGTGNSLGDGNRDGIGDKPGCPGCAGGAMPMCVYCPRADYTDEAVKAKYQGSVILSVVVTADGRARDIHVSKGLGLGLDEKAVEVVRTWRFKPVLGPAGKSIAVPVQIEVQFHLF